MMKAKNCILKAKGIKGEQKNSDTHDVNHFLNWAALFLLT